MSGEATTENIETGIEEMKANVDALRTSEGVTDEVLLGGDPDLGTGDEPEYTDTELRAMEKGWSPDKENLPEGKEWVDAGEFLRNEKFFAEINKLKRETRQTKQAFEALKEHHRKVQEVERSNLLEQLKRQKKAALEEADHDAVIEIDEQISEVKSAKPEAVTEPAAGGNEAFETWVEHNQWYTNDADMRQTADELGAAYFMRSGNKASPDEIYEYVEKRIKTLYSDKFAKPASRKRATPAVEGASTGRSQQRTTARKATAKDLSPDQRKVMKQFVKTGALTEQEYIDELIKIGELEV